MEIDAKYKTHLVGVYNKAVDICPYCGNRMYDRLFENCKGFAESDYGLMMVIECDKCFGNFYFHARDSSIHVIDTIKDGANVHFTADGEVV